MVAKLHFGVTLPQIKRTWRETRAAAETFEALGFDSVWLNDHLFGVPMPNLPILEAWTTLSAVAAATQRVRLGTLVSPVGFRNPALLAKMAATLDHISDGRVIVGLGCGWFQMEFEGYGYPFPPLRQRLEQLEEGAVLMKRLWTEPQVTFEGRHFTAHAAYCEPKPAQQPHPPLLIGGGGERVLLHLVAAHADIWNNLAVNQNELARKIARLREHCAQIDRPWESLTISQQCLVVIGTDEADANAKLQKAQAIYGGHMGAPGPLTLAGSPERLIDRIHAHVELGCTMFIMEFFGRDTREPARLFAERVLPAFA
jgi:F420-dependent oxidoreductase-like protein